MFTRSTNNRRQIVLFLCVSIGWLVRCCQFCTVAVPCVHVAAKNHLKKEMFLKIKFIFQALRVADGLQAGTCFVNTYNKTDVAAPFGGCKQSGFGKDLGELL